MALARRPDPPAATYAALALLARACQLLTDDLRPHSPHLPSCGNPYLTDGGCTDRCLETRAVLREAAALLQPDTHRRIMDRGE